MGKKSPPKRATPRGHSAGVLHSALFSRPVAQTIDPGQWRLAQQLLQAGELHQAQQLVNQMLLILPDEPNVLNLKAIIAARLNQPDVAEAAWRSLLRRNPRHVNARSNLGGLLLMTGRLDEAVAELRQTVTDAPDMVSAHTNLGVALERLGRKEEAFASYERSLAFDRNPMTLFNIGNLLQGQQDHAEAHRKYREALAIDPTFGDAFGNLVLTQHYLPNFDPAINKDTARHYATSLGHHTQRPAFRLTDGPLRVGMVSADLRTHSVAHFLGAVLAQLDPQRLQLYAYSNSEIEDQTTERLRRFFVGWQKIDTLNDREAAERIRDDGIDILIDLSGLTAGHRQGLFARRPAPLQLSWLGYFSTTGNAAIDYVLADPTTVPASEEMLFVEKIWRLPDIRYCFTPPDPSPPVAPLPASRQGHMTFGSFQTLPKINERVLRRWSRILNGVPGARLRIQNSQMDIPRMRTRFEEQLRAHGLPRDRVDLVGEQARDVYLASHAGVDIVLDTFPYPGGTTTAEALWMGVPTLTLALPGMLGRQGESIMKALALDEWVTRSEDEYVAQAIAWGNADPETLQQLAALRHGLRDRALRSPLFDARRFARHFEQALWDMWTINSGTPPGAVPAPQAAPSIPI